MRKPKRQGPLLTAGAILESLFKGKNSPLSEGYFLCQLNQVWEDLAGEEIAKNGRPILFKNSQLFIALPSSSHIQEMCFIREDLRRKINSRFPDRNIKRIIFQLRAPEKRAFPLLPFK